MRIYLEALELESAIEPDFIRAEVTDKTKAEEADILACIRDIMSGKEYILQRHFCAHDEDLPCRGETVT